MLVARCGGCRGGITDLGRAALAQDRVQGFFGFSIQGCLTIVFLHRFASIYF